MQKNAAVLIVVCLWLCLNFNYTFPLHRRNTKSSLLDNHTQQYHCKNPVHEGIVDRTKKMAANIEQALKNIIDTDSAVTKQVSKSCHGSQAALNGDLSNYEQLVIMKKYPFLDLKELELNYRPPPNKNIRQSLNLGPVFEHDPSFCESAEKGPNVEITNRGLSGFAIPSKQSINSNFDTIIEDSIRYEVGNETDAKMSSSSKQSVNDSYLLLESLKEDIQEFEKHLA